MKVRPRIFVAVDVASARRSAAEFVSAPAAVYETSCSVADALKIKQSCKAIPTPGLLNLDVAASARALAVLVSIVRSGDAVGFGSSRPNVPLDGIDVTVAGLRSDDEVYMQCVAAGMRPDEAVTAARLGKGSVDAAVDTFELMRRRRGVLRLIEAIRDKDLNEVEMAAEAFGSSDVEVLRIAVNEIRTGEFAMFTSRDLEILAPQVEFVASLVKSYVKSPVLLARVLGTGLYFSECGQV